MSEIHQYKLRNGSSPAWYDEGTGPTPDAWHLDCVQPDHIWRTVYQQGHEAALSQTAGVPDGWMRDVADAAASLDKRGDRQMAARLMRLHRDMLAAASPASGGDSCDECQIHRQAHQSLDNIVMGAGVFEVLHEGGVEPAWKNTIEAVKKLTNSYEH